MPRQPGHLSVVAVGKIRRSHWKSAQDDYLGRLRRYVKVELVEVRDVVGRGQPDAVAMQQEGEQLLQAAESAHRRIALTPRGKHMTSRQFARFLRQQIEIYGRLAFIIGGPLGLSDEVLAACEDQLSLSALTFPHELARVVLLEQLYRAFTIIHHENYHK